MSYTVLARRYRSQRFEDVVGQEAVAQTLKNAIATDRVAHAYLFSGTRGVGKTTMARILAKALNCHAADGPTTSPCCECASCVAINEGEDIDVLEVDGASNTGVEHVRELRQNAIYRPARSRFKIYIIDEVHMLSVSAFNALLKTLEEPPEHVKFIMATTEPNKVLATIQSRCQRFDFRNIRLDDIAGQLQLVLAGEGVESDEQVVRRVARLAKGSMRDALSVLDQLLSMSDGKLTADTLQELLGTPAAQRLMELVEAMAQGDLAGALRQVDEALGQGLALEQLAEALQGQFRDLMVIRQCGLETELVEEDDQAVRQRMMDLAGGFDEAALVYNITVLEELRRAIRTTGAGRALLEAALVRLSANERFSDTKVLLEQLAAGGPLTQGRPASGAAPQIPPGPSSGAAAPAAQGQGRNETFSRPNAAADVGKQTDSPARSADSGAAAPTVSGLNLPDELTVGYLQEHWEQILTLVQRQGMAQAQAYLRPARPVAWQQGKLHVGFDQDTGMGQFLQGQPLVVQEIGTALGKVLLRPVQLVIEQTVGRTAAANGSARRSPGAKPSQQEINKAMNDKRVQQVQRIMGGRVQRVERSGQSGDAPARE